MPQHRTTRKASAPSWFDVVKVLLRLGPKQIGDELSLAIAQMKAKGIAAGVAAALIVVGLVFAAFLTIALIVAVIAVLHLWFQLWAAALITAGGFLLIAVVFAGIGVLKFKKTLPLMPEDAIRGFRLDLGTAAQGSAFDPASLDRADEQKRRAKQEAAEKARDQAKKPGGGKPERPSYTELLRRTALRREHIASLQDAITSRLPQRSRAAESTTGTVTGERVTASEPASAGSASAQGAAADDSARENFSTEARDFVAARWKPLSVAVGSAAAAGVFIRELVKK